MSADPGYEEMATRGQLRIYLGYAPAIGTTCALLSEGHRRAAHGADVVVASAQTRGRPHCSHPGSPGARAQTGPPRSQAPQCPGNPFPASLRTRLRPAALAYRRWPRRRRRREHATAVSPLRVRLPRLQRISCP